MRREELTELLSGVKLLARSFRPGGRIHRVPFVQRGGTALSAIMAGSLSADGTLCLRNSFITARVQIVSCHLGQDSYVKQVRVCVRVCILFGEKLPLLRADVGQDASYQSPNGMAWSKWRDLPHSPLFFSFGPSVRLGPAA